MLKRVTELPTDRRIAGAHVVPVLADGSIVMAWNREERVLTTIGGRLEPGESVEQALEREAREEAGLTLQRPYRLLASWLWKSTDTYTVWYLAGVAAVGEVPPGFETAGRVICNVETAQGIIRTLSNDPGRQKRLQLLSWVQQALAE